jgi:hypothetical protein
MVREKKVICKSNTISKMMARKKFHGWVNREERNRIK